MDHIVEKVLKRIVEASEKDLMKFEAGIVISSDYQISDILTTIRAFSGVVIVSPGGDTQKMGELKERSTLTVKLLPPADLEEYLNVLVGKIQKIPGILSFRMRRIQD